jgi:hypothetical protein
MSATQLHLCQGLAVVAAGSWGGVGHPLTVVHLQGNHQGALVSALHQVATDSEYNLIQTLQEQHTVAGLLRH